MHGTNDHRAGRLAALAVVVSALAWALCVTGAQADKGGVPHAGSNGRGAQGAPPPATPGDDAAPAPTAPTKHPAPTKHATRGRAHRRSPAAERPKAKAPAAQPHKAAAPPTEA